MRDAEAGDAVVVAVESLAALARQRVPHVARKVVVPGKQIAARRRKAHRRDAAQNVLVRE